MKPLYKVVASYLKANKGSYNSLVDMGKVCGIDHPQKVANVLSQMQNKGYIVPNGPKSYTVTQVLSYDDERKYLMKQSYAKELIELRKIKKKYDAICKITTN